MEHIQIALDKARQRQDQSLLAFDRPREPSVEAIWSSLPERTPDPALLAANRIVTATMSDPARVAFGMLRTRVLQMIRHNNWTSIAITSPTPECGKTVVALNLAFSLARQKDCRTLLLDLDLRRPRVNELLGAKNAPAVERVLQGQAPAESVFVRYAENLAIATNPRSVGFSSELLQSGKAGEALKEVQRRLQPDVVLYDLPPMLCGDDVMAFLPNVDCAILVVAAEATKVPEVDLCERDLSEKTNLLGVVLNKCRYTQDEYGY
ncbi:hypothetical protein ATER59S_03207 [Aquamicrobium terrae]